MLATRRDLILTAAAAPLAAATEIPKRPLGRTGLNVSIMGLGGARMGNLDSRKDAEAVIRRCHELGVNYFDAAAAGAYGMSQKWYGPVLKSVRDRIVYGTKTRNRSATQSQLDLDQSLANLQTDYIDLYQLHNVINDEDIDFIFGPKGVMETVEKAKKAGKIRFVGVTGHTTPAVLNRIIGMYDFATVLMPLSLTDGGNAQKSFEKETLPLAKKKGMGVIAMKVLGAGAILKNKAASVDECLRYTWTLPISTAIMGCDAVAHVDHDLALARSAKPLTAMEMDGLRRRAQRFGYAALEPWKLGREEDPSGPVYRAD
jgi:predicted aldo/keto reductase-like oxidoreductase